MRATRCRAGEEIDWLWARSIFSRTEGKKEKTAAELKAL